MRRLAKRTPVPAKPVPQTEEEAAHHAQEHVNENGVVKRLDAEEAQKIADVKQRYADRKKPHIVARDEHEALAQAWGEANRHGRKTIKLSNGRELQWRLPSSPSLLFDEDKLETIEQLFLKLKDWRKYLRVELRKNNIKADLEGIHKASSGLRHLLHLDKTEFFRIT